MHTTTKTLIAVTVALAIASNAEAQDQGTQPANAAALTAPTGPAPAPVVQVPTSSAQQQAGQAAQRPAPMPQQQMPQQQMQMPQQTWGYAYPPPTGYPVAGVPGVHYGYQTPVPQPQYHFEDQERATKGLYVPGIILFGIGWVGNFAIATPAANMASDDRPDAAEEDAWAWSVVPIVGPIAQLAIGAPHPAIAITMGLMQIGGLALFIAGLVSKETVQVRVAGPPDGNGTTVDLDVVPMEGGGALQLTVGHL